MGRPRRERPGHLRHAAGEGLLSSCPAGAAAFGMAHFIACIDLGGDKRANVLLDTLLFLTADTRLTMVKGPAWHMLLVHDIVPL